MNKISKGIVRVMNEIARAMHNEWPNSSIEQSRNEFESMYEELSYVARRLKIDLSNVRDIYDDQVYTNINEDLKFEQLSLFSEEDFRVNDKKESTKSSAKINNRHSNGKIPKYNSTNGGEVKKKI